MTPINDVSLIGLVVCYRYHAIMLSLSCYHAITDSSLFFNKIYNRLKNDFFFTIVNKKEFFFLCNLFVTNIINKLLKRKNEQAAKISGSYKTSEKIDCYQCYHAIAIMLSCYHAIASTPRNLENLGVKYE